MPKTRVLNSRNLPRTIVKSKSIRAEVTIFYVILGVNSASFRPLTQFGQNRKFLFSKDISFWQNQHLKARRIEIAGCKYESRIASI